LIFGIVLFTNNTVIVDKTEEEFLSEIKVVEYSHSDILFLENNFTAFKEALAFKESQGKYKVVNTLGYLGKYQFGITTLERFNIHNPESFLSNPELQERAFSALCSVNKWILRKDIKRSVGKIINGITITESGILAAAHLSGAGNVKKYLRTNGNYNLSDAYGSSIEYYMEKFAGYDVSQVIGDRKASVTS
jgi:hypothetical protein